MPDAPDKIRCFVATPVDPSVVERLTKTQQELARTIREDWVRWTTAEQMHLTLKFLGSVPAEVVPSLEAAFRSACDGASAFTLTAKEAGGFPSLRNPRVLWVGLGGDLEELQTLQSRIDAAISPWAQKAENRPFHPHLTLGRVRENAARHGRRIGEQLKAIEAREFGSWRVTHVCLMRSHLSPKGSTYTTLAEVVLGGGSG